MAVNGKVILKVKSGPGVIIGDTERDIIDNELFIDMTNSAL